MPVLLHRSSPGGQIAFRRATAIVATLVLMGALSACFPSAPVAQLAPVEHSQFEGFDVVSSIPHHPQGLVFLFHGHYGSANFAEKVETVDALNRLTVRGYGYVSTDSTDRVNKQWDRDDISLTTNPDLARLARLHAHLVATDVIRADTPILAIGMSNGGAFTSVFTTAFAAGGYPVRAAWVSNAPITAAVRLAGGLRVPTIFTVAENDSVVSTPQIVRQQAELAAAGIRTALYTQTEASLNPQRFRRIPGIDAGEALAFFHAEVATGAWDAAGHRTATTVAEAVRLANTVALPASVQGDARNIENQVAITLAEHAFSATYANEAVAFLTAD